jgi:arylsulfatase A-like enzyme
LEFAAAVGEAAHLNPSPKNPKTTNPDEALMKALATRRSLLFSLFVILHSAFRAEGAPPNIVFVYADNLGSGDLGCYGRAEVKTPNIDRLAAEGVRCTDFHVVTATCTVSRGAVLTGRHPLRNGLLHQLGSEENWHGVGLPHRERIMPQYLREVGYATACFGKWNLGFAPGSRPTERGFDEFLGCRSGNINYFTHTYHGEYDIFRGTERHRVEGYSGDIFADAACDFIRRQSGAKKPFFIYLPFNAPHYVSSINMPKGVKPQWQAPASAFAAYGWTPDETDEKRRYLAVLTALDENVGRVLAALDASGQRENTLVLFTSDMGPILRPTHGLGVASAGLYRHGAPTLYEGGIRVPTIFRWPGRIAPGSVSRAMLSHLDLLPTFLKLAGIEPPEGRILDGRDCLPALSENAATPHARLFFHLGEAVAVREGTLKLLRSKAGAPWELYDLATDPSEKHDLAAQRPNDVTRLAEVMAAWQSETRNDASEPVRYVAKPKAAGK